MRLQPTLVHALALAWSVYQPDNARRLAEFAETVVTVVATPSGIVGALDDATLPQAF